MPYRIAFFSKYPPLEGGISAKTYWLACGLAARGHSIHIITHGISAGQEYRIPAGESPPGQTPNLQIHRPFAEIPWHIPEDSEHALTLLDLAIKIIRKNKIQILDTGYLVPYGVLGHICKMSTGVCHVIRHGGSDLEKFLKKGVLETVFNEAIALADVVITAKSNQSLLQPLASRLVFQPAYVPDGSAFTPRHLPEPRWRLAVIGKINYHWEHKGLHLVAEVMRWLTEHFECWIVGQGKGISSFTQSLGSELVSNLKWYPFVPPWEMPNLLNKLDGIFMFESRLPHPVVSNLALEAIYSGVGIITDRPDFGETYRDLVTINKNQVLVVCPSASTAAEMITEWVQERARARKLSRQLFTYQEYLSATEEVYADALDASES